MQGLTRRATNSAQSRARALNLSEMAAAATPDFWIGGPDQALTAES